MSAHLSDPVVVISAVSVLAVSACMCVQAAAPAMGAGPRRRRPPSRPPRVKRAPHAAPCLAPLAAATRRGAGAGGSTGAWQGRGSARRGCRRRAPPRPWLRDLRRSPPPFLAGSVALGLPVALSTHTLHHRILNCSRCHCDVTLDPPGRLPAAARGEQGHLLTLCNKGDLAPALYTWLFDRGSS